MNTDEKPSFTEIDRGYRQTLHNLDQLNKPLLICFSGAPGSGKTTLAKKIETKFKAIKIGSDGINDAINRLKPELTSTGRRKLIRGYLFYLLDELKGGKNKLLIIDSSIDRKYKAVYDWGKKNGFDLFIITLNVPEHELERRLKQRENYYEYLPHLENWIAEFEEFNWNHVADFYSDSWEANNPDTLYNKIRLKLKQ